MKAKVIRFRIYGTPTLYFNVFIHPTFKSMYQANKEMRPNFSACVRGKDAWYKRGRKLGHRLGLCGDIHFCRRAIAMGIVSRELTHATLSAARRLRLDPMTETPGNLIRKGKRDTGTTPDEEKFCLIHGRLMSGFTDKAYELGLYDVA